MVSRICREPIIKLIIYSNCDANLNGFWSKLLAILVNRRSDSSASEEFSQVFDLLLTINIALMWVVQELIETVQIHMEDCPMCGLDAGAQMMQQRFNFTPVDIAADRIMKDGTNQIDMFMAHSGCILMFFKL